jgi:hypothetical protein
MIVFQSQAREEQDTMAQAAAGKAVRIETRWFQQGYAHGVSGATSHKMPSEPREETVVDIVQRILDIVEDDGEISEEQLRYECGLLAGYLVSTIG